jgi:hypothetical protein
MTLCPHLKSLGFCTTVDCSADHPDVCSVCDKIKLLTDPDAHNLSGMHLRTVFDKGALNAKICPPCKASFNGSAHNFAQHFRSPRHLRTCNRKGISSYAELAPETHKNCRPCGRLIKSHQWSAHLQGSPHRNRLRAIKKPSLTALQQDLMNAIDIMDINLKTRSPDDDTSQSASFEITLESQSDARGGNGTERNVLLQSVVLIPSPGSVGISP